ncbi:septum site-determining protein MinC [Collimonas sp.]|jgi:septum site-determining protein MinC|uniref:septum site-determining protein MinC n=1 Tax=Collimonas sp. TaxID=1963772 RepID=UPI002CC9BF6E|nr:septum site-determining protein MinC [Collimonas sp.]HWX01981.1 septum site-determining protein MinC [Collimonas sp.]
MLKNKSRKPIEIKIATVVAVSAILHDSDPMALEAALQEMTGGTADFFDNEFAVIDIAALGTDRPPIDWPQLVSLLKKYRLNAVAVRNAPTEMEADILASGLSIDQMVAARQEPAAAPPPPPAPLATPAKAAASTMIIDTPIRAGQRIYARDADLVITATVNNGAEIIADGSIHVYAPLRGRALAGASGDTSARIFAASMEAELVSIAGVYRTFENGLPPEQKGQPAQIRLSGDRIDVLSLNSASRN